MRQIKKDDQLTKEIYTPYIKTDNQICEALGETLVQDLILAEKDILPPCLEGYSGLARGFLEGQEKDAARAAAVKRLQEAGFDDVVRLPSLDSMEEYLQTKATKMLPLQLPITDSTKPGEV